MSEERVQLGSSLFCSDGVYCSISANSHKDVFIVYHRNLVSKGMYYKLGKVTAKDELTLRSDKEELDQCVGERPRVAISDDRMVVVVFTIKPFSLLSSSNSSIKYSIGKFKEDRRPVSWERSKTICDGGDPSIAISGEKVLLVYSKATTVFYKTGLLNYSSRTIEWRPEQAVDANACYPSVALTDTAFTILYKDHHTSRLKTVVGEVVHCQGSPAYEIVPGSVQDDTECRADSRSAYEGFYPSVAMLADNTIIATHQRGEAGFRKLYARSGEVNTAKKSIEWHENRVESFIPGAFSSVSAIGGDRKQFIEAHTTNRLGGCTLWYEVGSIE